MPRPLASYPYDSTISSRSRDGVNYYYDLNTRLSCGGHFATKFDSMKAA